MNQSAKKMAVAALSVGLVATLTVGGTLAFMTRETEHRVNNFTFAGGESGLNAILTEPTWDGVIDYEYAEDGSIKNVIYAYIDHDNDPGTESIPVYGYTDGDKSKPITDPEADAGRGTKAIMDSTDVGYKPEYGAEQSKNMIPGQSAQKNPIITNTGVLIDEWVAAKVTFVYRTGAKAGQPLELTDMAKVTDVIEIDWNLGGSGATWERVGGQGSDVSQTFYYQTLLKKGNDGADAGTYGDSTAALFSAVKVKENASTAQIKALEDIGGFAIYVEGFAVQSDVGENYAGFKAWAFGDDQTFGGNDDNVVFANTPSASAPADVTEPGIIAAQTIG